VSTDDATWLGWARELHSIAQEGLTYADSPFDRKRYSRLREITAELTAALAEGPPDPIRLSVMGEAGYLTPKIDVRAAVHDDQGRVLMVREASDGLWTLPGGWADVNESLAEGAVREVWEESGYLVECRRMLGIYERERWGHPAMSVFTLKAVFGCSLVGGEATTSYETDAVGWFGRGEIPQLSRGRISEQLLARVFEHHDDPTLPADMS
jgi:ADP-ribose pyrophosphatase YjhB (NUDIX family)